ncbi:ABC transporter permease [Botrimarina hoheduenensis]|uniref:Putative aliphatic sulfonates transport permease protein SsuC n=1 Tax=Botrimarina hoheduenensis TaxID=2528000 RepID=A0A5C5VQC7_9BACT|nr:ABC transporter permease [Botrimarina hoheduenensis]TWT40848.1 putative aliphatic sulfonates transport permease protein SsuC [Botrimarina hoheduenensis]
MEKQLVTLPNAPLPFVDRLAVRIAAPVIVAALALGGWEAYVRIAETPSYILPAPTKIVQTLWSDRAELSAAWIVTLKTMFSALGLAVAGGVVMAVLFSASRLLEISLFPPAVVLQVTPLIAIAPLLSVWLGDQPWLVLLLCAFIVAFFPILSNTVAGLQSVDHGHRDLMRLYGASPLQRLWMLQIPSMLPYFLTGLKVAANLALVGAIVAEFAVGAGGKQTGLASTILESGFRLEVPRMFAALALVSFTGVAVYFLIHALSTWLLSPWHDSAVRRDT